MLNHFIHAIIRMAQMRLIYTPWTLTVYSQDSLGNENPQIRLDEHLITTLTSAALGNND